MTRKCDTNRHRCKAWCCKQFWIILPSKPNKDMKNYLELYGVVVKENVLTLYQRCKNLTENNKCAAYGKITRPGFCRLWDCKDPRDPDKI